MKLVSISDAQPGQIIARAVTNAGGAVLCPRGFTLTETVIERLKNAGVESVLLEGGEPSGLKIQARLAALDIRFTGIDDPIMLQLKAAIEKRLDFMRIQ